MLVNKNSWHYKIRSNWNEFVNINAGREVNIDIDVSPLAYFFEVFLGAYMFFVFRISQLFFVLFKIIGLEFIISKIYKLKNKIKRKKSYVKFK